MQDLAVDGQKVKALRDSRGLTQGGLALKAKVGQSHISRLESGLDINVKIRTINRLARALGVAPVELLENAGVGPQEDLEPNAYLAGHYGIDMSIAHSMQDILETFLEVHRRHAAERTPTVQLRTRVLPSGSMLAFAYCR